MTGIELKYVMVAHLELTGNCYWLLDGVTERHAHRRARSIRSIPAACASISTKGRVSLQARPLHVHDRQQGIHASSRTKFCISNIPTRTTRSSASAFVQSIPSWIDSDNYAMEYNRKFFINGASDRPLYPNRYERRREHRPHPQQVGATGRQASRTRTSTPSCPRA